MISIDLIFIPSLGAFTPAIALGVGNLLVLIASIVRLNILFKSHGKA